MPQPQSEEQRQIAEALAFEQLYEERSRSKAGFINPGGSWSAHNPDGPSGSSDGWTAEATPGMSAWMTARFPALKGLPDEMIRSLPLATLLQLNEALVKDTKAARKMDPEARLTHNMEELTKNPVQVEAGLDNRRDLLHKARFLGGSGNSFQSQWLLAREVLGLEGVPAIGTYDLDSVGCGGSVTAKGWQELHNPSSTSMALKLFHITNVTSGNLGSRKVSMTGGEAGFNLGDNLKEIHELEEMKNAMTVLREAMAAALPWNKSISAIQGFLNTSNYCSRDLSARSNRAAIITSFINYVLSRNAVNWQNRQNFLSTNELLHVWSTWFGQQPASSIGAAPDANRSKKQAAGPAKDKARPRDDLCRRYNGDGCNTVGLECRTFYGTKLRHLCNAKLPGGAFCEKQHSKKDHTP